MVRHWWALVLRGVIAVIFGVVLIAQPGIALATLVLLAGIYMFADGLFAIVGSLAHREHYQHWWLALVEGVIGVIAGVVAFLYPALTALTLVYIIGFWSVLTGVLEIGAAIRLRAVIANEWLLAVSGILSILFGLFIIIFPGAGALSILWLIAGYALIFGVLMIMLGLWLRTWRPPSSSPTSGNTPTSTRA
jgi:uncharacterized membrane protein HdeD (DUF308 family)